MKKRAKLLGNPSDEEQGIDRLSALPDSMLSHILWFLPMTKDTIVTSILARSWSYLWTEIPFLCFDFEDLDLRMNEGTDCTNLNCTVRKCKNWVGNGHGREGIFCARRGYYDVLSSIMLLHKVKNLDSFGIAYSVYDLTDSQLISCITEAIARGAADVTIYCECKGVKRGVKSLVIDCHCKRVNGVKNYDIDWECKGEHWVTTARRKRRNFGNKLPLSVFCWETLVCLRLTGCFLYISPGVQISLMSLTKLLLKNNGYGDVDTLPRLISGCPVLEKITIIQGFYQKFGEVKYPQTLIKADICFYFRGVWWPGINSLYTVKSLILYCASGVYDDIVFNLEYIKNRFTNLIRLDFTVFQWHYLFKFLETADILKDLVVCVENVYCGWFAPTPVPNCVISHLETVEIGGLIAAPAPSAFHLVRYLLKNARVLKKMTICMPKPNARIVPLHARIVELQDRISSLDWGSTKCKLVFKYN